MIKNVYLGRFNFLTFFLILSVFFSKISLSKDFLQYKQDIIAVESYLNSIEKFSAKFSQKSEKGLAQGKFFLVRGNKSSGKMRVEYDGDPKVLIVVNGSVLSYYDIELDEISRLSTNTTPASFLTRPNISFFAKDVEITDVVKNQNQIKISIIKKNRQEAGEFSLTFKLSPVEFSKMEVKNELGDVVSVTLSDINFNDKIPDKMFILKDKNSL